MSGPRESQSAEDQSGTQGDTIPGRIIVISAPSGAGKTSIARLLLERFPSWRFSISATTRPKRDYEVGGIDYYFFDRGEFEQHVGAGDMVEWEEIYGNLYGTLRSEVDRLLADAGVDALLFDVDVKGALSIRDAFPEETTLVFIAPPSIDVLEDRLRGRNTETEETLQRRMDRARMEMTMQDRFDIVVVNDDLVRAVDELVSRLHPGPDESQHTSRTDRS